MLYLEPYSRRTLQFACGLGAICLILAVLAYLWAPYCPQPHRALVLYRGFREAGPATVAAGVCAALICDLVLKDKRSH